ncbi:DUF7010 family protein [Priestia taiwanensis]|uniref:Uncharacterized protein n=1 Tax=Priestia taiwanensis TaxID=1347902 RepID=A0A917AS37_9BACI|nr:hypothetical protein [Priestia taiwanensis]MBM7363943.1 hypothetical protein [Priestia taiwanensis]GGE70356.1 hypothetical protein GCM10007140_20340 [Priestia taiwanensis]
MELETLRDDLAVRSKRGLHFILTSIVLWIGILVVWLLPIKEVAIKNLLTFCILGMLAPIAFMMSKLIKVEFSIKDNPLNKLVLVLVANQVLYIFIAMWIYQAVPDKMAMIIAVIFGAHLLPFGWVYKSKAYFVMSVVISIAILLIGITFSTVIVASVMIGFEILFAIWLSMENKSVSISTNSSVRT